VHENLSGDGPDYGLIAPISIPAGNRIPDELTGIATPAEYDRYFRLSRDSIDLADWTRTCLTVHRELVEDLGNSALGESDKQAILVGLVTVQDITLSRWLGVATDMAEKAS
jgi:hypothetical protein